MGSRLLQAAEICKPLTFVVTLSRTRFTLYARVWFIIEVFVIPDPNLAVNMLAETDFQVITRHLANVICICDVGSRQAIQSIVIEFRKRRSFPALFLIRGVDKVLKVNSDIYR